MRIMMAAMLLAAAPAYAANCNAGLIEVTSWTATLTNSSTPYLDGSVRISAKLSTSSEDEIEMVDGGIVFTDALGREIGKIKINPDAKLAPSLPFYHTGFYHPSDLDRLATLKPESVKATTCVIAVLFSDGKVVRFDEGS